MIAWSSGDGGPSGAGALARRRSGSSGIGSGRQRHTQHFQQLPARALRRGLNRLDDLLHPVGDRIHLQIEVARTRHGDMQDRAVDLEEVQAAMGEVVAQAGDQLERETLLQLEFAPRQTSQSGRQRFARRRRPNDVVRHPANDIGQVNLTEMLLHRLAAVELQRFGQVEADELVLEALLLHPLLHHRLVTRCEPDLNMSKGIREKRSACNRCNLAW